jgi:hypothetical protein
VSSSLWLTAVQALAGQFAALPGYRSFQSSTSAPCTVFVGAQVDDEELPDGASTGYVVIGYAGTQDKPTPSGTFRQTRGPMSSARERDETAQVRVRCCAQPGAGGIVAAAEQAEGYLRDLESLLTANPTLGISAPTSRRFLAQLDNAGGWYLQQTDGGPLATVDVVVTYTARI